MLDAQDMHNVGVIIKAELRAQLKCVHDAIKQHSGRINNTELKVSVLCQQLDELTDKMQILYFERKKTGATKTPKEPAKEDVDPPKGSPTTHPQLL